MDSQYKRVTLVLMFALIAAAGLYFAGLLRDNWGLLCFGLLSIAGGWYMIAFRREIATRVQHGAREAPYLDVGHQSMLVRTPTRVLVAGLTLILMGGVALLFWLAALMR